jgi:cellulose synthase/poly-beta-1,6-N-acetylglucosamine synthase-like glycosyltransferase
MLNEKVEVDLSVAICTCNGGQRIGSVLERLTQQMGTEFINWEILIIDNNSTDNTHAVVLSYQSQQKGHYPLRYCFEVNQGLTFARARAIQEARGRLVGFIDDDNLPALDWVAKAHQFGIHHVQVGAFGGRVVGKFTTLIPAGFAKIQSLLALQDYGAVRCLLNPARMQLPSGAGLIVRRAAWLTSVPQKLTLKGRVGHSLLSGEDYEAVLHIYRQGWEIWYEPELEITHVIPEWRLRSPYLRAIAWGSGLVMCHLWMVGVARWKFPWVLCKTMLGNLRQVLCRLGQYRWRILTDWVTTVEITFFLAATISPLYFLYAQLRWSFAIFHNQQR